MMSTGGSQDESVPEAEGPSAEPELGGSALSEVDPLSVKAEPEAWPEAGPDWDVAKSAWEEAWPFHVYFFAMVFLMVSLVAIYIAVCSLLHKGPRSSMNKTTIALAAMVCSFSLTRAVFLLMDPYFSENVVPFLAARLVWSLGIPGFTASFSIMLLILLDTTRLSLGPPRFQNVGTVLCIWLVHMVIVIATDILVIYLPKDVKAMLVVCQMLFVLYGALVSLGYAFVGVKMRSNLKASSGGYHEDEQTRKLRRLVTMTFMSSVVAFSVAIINIYTAFSQFGPYSNVEYVEPWPYWSVHTCSRFLEAAACCLVLTLFFRSGKGSHSYSLCDQCRPWRRQRGTVQPKPTSDKSAVSSTTSDVTGIMWRQRTDTSSLCQSQQ